MKISHEKIIRGLVVSFALLSISAVLPLGPLMGYHHIDFFHCWVHVVLAILGFLAALSLTTARIYLALASILFLAFAIGGFLNGGNFLLMHFLPHPIVDFVHLGLAVTFFYFGVIFKTK